MQEKVRSSIIANSNNSLDVRAMESSLEMQTPFTLMVLLVLTVTAGISAQVLGRFWKIPSIVFLLLFGILLGPSVTNLINPDRLGNEGLEVLISLAVAIILFEGGLTLDLRSLTKLSTSLRNLVTIGTAIALGGGGLAAHYLGGFSWQLSFLYASLVVVTGPTVIGPLLQQVRVDRRVATLLEGEGVLIDPVGAFVAVLVLNAIIETPDPTNLVQNFLTRIAIGIAIGASAGWGLGWALKRAHFLDENIKSLVVLAGVWGLFAFSQAIQDESGLMATVVAGMVLSASEVPALRSLKRFQGQLTVLGVSVLFILLAADLSLETVLGLGWGSLLTILALMLVVRPTNIFVCTWGSEFNWRQKLFISWIGPKGIVSASVASLFAFALDERGLPGGSTVKALVFLTIVVTVVIQGLSAQWVAKFLQVNATAAKGAVIVGANPLARLIARLFQERDEPVVFIETKADEVKAAEEENFTVFFKSAMNPEVLEEAGLDSLGTFLAMTNNGEVNYILAQRAAEEFNPPRVLALCPAEVRGQPSVNAKVQPAFTFEMDLKTWNQHIEAGEVKLIETEFETDGFTYQQTYFQALIDAGEIVPLLLERQGRLLVVQAGQRWELSDRLFCLLYEPKPRLVLRLSESQPPRSGRLTLEKFPTIKELPIPSERRSGIEAAAQEILTAEASPNDLN